MIDSLIDLETLETNDAFQKTLVQDSIQIVNERVLANKTMVKLGLPNDTHRPSDIYGQGMLKS